MKVPRLLAAAAAAGLLAAGCDYWRNLVDEKNPTVVPLTIQVIDAFTREPLPAACSDSSRGLSFETKELGSFSIQEAGTGSYTLHCSTQHWYYDRTLKFNVEGTGGLVTVELARKPGEEWYPEQPDKWVRIIDPVTSMKVNSPETLTSSPRDSSGVLRYEWIFAKNTQFNRGKESIRASKPYLNLLTDASVGLGADTVTLHVYASLAGRPEYQIDSFPMAFNWTRYRPPSINHDNSPATTRKVGCSEHDEFTIAYSVADPDDVCKQVVFSTRDSNSALGLVNMTRSCHDGGFINFPLRNPFKNLQSNSALTQDNKLLVEVFDNNNGVSRDSFEFQAYSNTSPVAFAGRINPRPGYFLGNEVRIWIEGADSDGHLENMRVNWGDESSLDTLKNSPVKSMRDTVGHIYETPGSFSPSLFVIDDCHAIATYNFPARDSIRIRENSKPDIAIDTNSDFYPLEPNKYKLTFNVTDADVDARIDKLDVVINWGDGKSQTLPTTFNSLFNISIDHSYLGPPSNGVAYKLSIQATDSQNAQDVAIRLVPYQP